MAVGPAEVEPCGDDDRTPPLHVGTPTLPTARPTKALVACVREVDATDNGGAGVGSVRPAPERPRSPDVPPRSAVRAVSPSRGITAPRDVEVLPVREAGSGGSGGGS